MGEEQLCQARKQFNLITPGKRDNYWELILSHDTFRYELPGSQYHFPQKNQVGWARVTERTISGKRTLMVEEVQNDIRQRGRTHGYRSDDNEAANLWMEEKYRLDDLVEMERAATDDILKYKLDNLGFNNSGEAKGAILANPDYAQRWDISDPKHIEAFERYKQAYAAKRDHELSGENPENSLAIAADVPFKKSWPLVVMKRIIRYAVDNGFDQVAWTTGAIQNERYDLSYHLNAITYRKVGGLWDIEASSDDDFEVYESSGLNEQQLRNEIGEELAQKIIDHKGPAYSYPAPLEWLLVDAGMPQKTAKRHIDQLIKMPTTFGEPEGEGNRPTSDAWDEITDALKEGQDAVIAKKIDLMTQISRLEASLEHTGYMEQLFFNGERDRLVNPDAPPPPPVEIELHALKNELREVEELRAQYYHWDSQGLNDTFHDQDWTKGRLEGLDLEVGGEGMKGFYDKMLPAMVGKFAKKYGARVSEGEIYTKGSPDWDNVNDHNNSHLHDYRVVEHPDRKGKYSVEAYDAVRGKWTGMMWIAEGTTQRVAEEYLLVQQRNMEKVTVEIPIGPKGKAKERVQRYWYHSPPVLTPGHASNTVRGYNLRAGETELLDLWSPSLGNKVYGSGRDIIYQMEGIVWLSPTKRSDEDLVIDLQEVNRNYVRKTGQQEGYAIHLGNISDVAVVHTPEREPVHTLPLTDKLKEAAAKGFAMFRRKQGLGSTQAEVAKWLKKPIAKLPGWVDVKVVQSVGEVTIPGNHPDNVVAVRRGNQVQFVADNIDGSVEAHTALAHEVVGHIGIEALLEDKFESLLNDVMKIKAELLASGGKNEMTKVLDEIRTNYLNEYGEYTLDARTEAKEILAHLAENKPMHSKLRALYRKLVNLVKLALAKYGMADADMAQINSIIINANRLVYADRAVMVEKRVRIEPVLGEMAPTATQEAAANDVAPPRNIAAARLQNPDYSRRSAWSMSPDELRSERDRIEKAREEFSWRMHMNASASGSTPMSSSDARFLEDIKDALGEGVKPWWRRKFSDTMGRIPKKAHRKQVENALARGAPVPADVLAEYPDLDPDYARGEPQDKASRMARAKADGFITDRQFYHGTLSDFTAFETDVKDTSLGGIHVGSKEAATQLVDQKAGPSDHDWDMQQTIGNTPQIMPVLIKPGKTLKLDDLGIWNWQNVIREARKKGVQISEQEYDAVFNSPNENLATRELLKSKGYNSISYRNHVEAPGSLSYLLFDADQVRSVHAAFDPEKSGADDMMYSRKTARMALQKIAMPSLFQYPTSMATDLVTVMRDLSAGSVKMTENEHIKEEWYSRETVPKHQRADRVWTGVIDLYDENGDWKGNTGFDVIQAGRSVWANLSTMQPGSTGAMVYSAIANYAHNNGLQFIGDPDGLSPLAFHRRNEMMLSSALKHGTTKHLLPSPIQRGDFSGATNPERERANYLTTGYLDWIEGHHDYNIEQMLELSYNNAFQYIVEQQGEGFEGISSYQFDPSTNQFRSRATGEVLTQDDLERIAQFTGSRSIGAGFSTIKRALLTQFFWENKRTLGVSLVEWLAKYSNGSPPNELAQLYYSRKGKLGQNQRKGTLRIVKKEYPEIHAAAMTALKRMPAAEKALLRKNLKEHAGTGWAAIAVKSLAIREIMHQVMHGYDAEALMNDSFWENDPISRYKTIMTALSRGEPGVRKLSEFYNFVGTNRKAENDFSGSYLSCNPSKGCATFCYATTGLLGTHVHLLKSEFTELASAKFPRRGGRQCRQALQKFCQPAMSHLALRMNDIGDLSLMRQ